MHAGSRGFVAVNHTSSDGLVERARAVGAVPGVGAALDDVPLHGHRAAGPRLLDVVVGEYRRAGELPPARE